MNRLLITDDEIIAAVSWRLSNLGDIAIAEYVERLITFSFDLERFSRSGNVLPWATVCALAVRAAAHVGNTELFYKAGFEVIKSRDQSRRGETLRADDNLDRLIKAHLLELPDIAPQQLWNEFVRQATDRCGRIFDEYEENILYFWPDSKRDTTEEINFSAFRKRVQRCRRRIGLALRVSRPKSSKVGARTE